MQGADLIVSITEKEQPHHDLRKTCLLNTAVASNKLGDFATTINKTTEALYIDNKAAKAYFLRAQAKRSTKDFEGALVDIKEAIKLSPADKALRDEFEAIKAAKQKEVDHEKEIAKKLFSGQGLYGEKAAPPKPKESVSGLPAFKTSNP